MYDRYITYDCEDENWVGEWINVPAFNLESDGWTITRNLNPVQSVFVTNARKMSTMNARLVVFIVPMLLIFALLSSFALKRRIK